MDKDTNTLNKFFLSGQSAHYSKGQVVIAGDEPNPEVYFVTKGFIKVYSISDDGEEYVHIIYKTGDIFPFIWALNGIRRRIFYESIDSSVLWRMPRDQFLTYLKANSDKVTYSVLLQLSDQFNVYADRLDNLEYRSAAERVVYRLLFLAGRFGQLKGNSVIIDAPITHKLIAQSINLARESVSRELEKLGARGLVDSSGGNIVINDIQKLSKEFSVPVSLDLWGLE